MITYYKCDKYMVLGSKQNCEFIALCGYQFKDEYVEAEPLYDLHNIIINDLLEIDDIIVEGSSCTDAYILVSARIRSFNKDVCFSFVIDDINVKFSVHIIPLSDYTVDKLKELINQMINYF